MKNRTLRYDKGTLLIDGGEDENPPEGFRFDPRIGQWRGRGMDYRSGLAWLHRGGGAYADEARAYVAFSRPHRLRRTPYSHQAEAIEAWRENGKRGVVVLPTGSGKTYVAEMAIHMVQRSTLIVAPTVDLMTQWYDRLSLAFGAPIGLLGGGHHEMGEISVTTYDSASIHMEKLGNRFGLVIYDEVHHLPGPTYSLSAEGMIAPFRLGLTATLERTDGRHEGLEHWVGPVVYRREITELAGNILADYRVERLEVELNPVERERYEESRGQYRDFIRSHRIPLGGPNGWREFLGKSSRSREGRSAFHAYREQKRIALTCEAKVHALEMIFREHWGEGIIIFTNDNATVYSLSKRFLIPAITHQTHVKERKEILDGLREGTLPAVVTSRVLNEGVDVPSASVGVVLSGTGSVREHVQRLGRILRRGEGKQAVLYEMVTVDTGEARTSERRREHSAF